MAFFGVPGQLISGSTDAADSSQYIFLNFSRGYDQNDPNSIVDDLFTAPLRLVGVPQTAARKLGLSFIFSYLNGPPDRIAETLRGVLAQSQKHRVPVLIVLDGQNWWGYRPDLWNWWDPRKPGYDPKNTANVEWTDWGPEHALKIAWRNWGSQIRVLPPPNLASPRFRAVSREQLLRLSGIIKEWAGKLPANENFLFPGIKIGWEASVGINAFYYPNGNQNLDAFPEDSSRDPHKGLEMNQDFSGGLVPLGYAAMAAKGWQHPGPITLADQERITADYLAFLARTCREAGLRREKIFTHAGGQYAPWEKHYSHRVAINPDSLPGWSLYGLLPESAGDLGNSLESAGLETWAAAEWWPASGNSESWREAFERTLGFKKCKFITVYNWQSLRELPEALEGLRRALKQTDRCPGGSSK